MLVKIYPENPNPREVRKVVEVLQSGGLVIYPTDTVYGMGCDIKNIKAVERVAQIKGLNLKKILPSIICYDLSHLSDYTKPLDNHIFKMVKKNIPGPFTFILPANNNIPKIFQNNRKTIGLRIPDNPIIREIVKELGNPVLNSSIKDYEDEILQYITDPELIHEKYSDLVDIVIDGGYGDNEPSTIIDCTSSSYEIIRHGKGMLQI